MATETKSKKENNIFAIVQSGGKQYKVSEGTVIDVEKLNVEAGEKITLDEVLLYFDGKETSIGQPSLDNVTVAGKVLNQIKDKKKIIFKFKNKTGYKKKQGHRQKLTTILIEGFSKKAKKTQAKKVESSTEKAAKKNPAANEKETIKAAPKAKTTKKDEKD